MPTPRYSRRYKRLFFSTFAAFSVVFAAGSVLTGYRYLTAGQATAEIIGVEHSRSTLYTVRFVTEDGRHCQAVLASGESPQRSVGSQVTIRYDQPCLNAWHPNDRSGVMFPIVAFVFLAAGLVGAFFAWFRTGPDGRANRRTALR